MKDFCTVLPMHPSTLHECAETKKRLCACILRFITHFVFTVDASAGFEEEIARTTQRPEA